MGKLNVLSVFDGMSCAQIALERAGIEVNKYYASELDNHAIKVTQHNYPNTIQLGDVCQVKAKDLPKIGLLVGGSPCQGFSFAGKQLAFDDPRSKLFFEYVRIWKEIKEINPDAKFLLENVRMKKEHELVISRYLGVEPIVINSALVSAQNRVRYYWTNIANEPYGLFGDMRCTIPQPKDKGILLKDIIEDEVNEKYYIKDGKMLDFITDKWRQDKKYTQINGEKAITQQARQYENWCGDFVVTDKQGKIKPNQNKASCFTAGGNSGGNHSDMDLIVNNQAIELNESMKPFGTSQDQKISPTHGKSQTLNSGHFNQPKIQNDRIRRLTPVECERLQTVPDNFTESVSDTQRYKMLGNGFTVDVIAHILKYYNG